MSKEFSSEKRERSFQSSKCHVNVALSFFLHRKRRREDELDDLTVCSDDLEDPLTRPYSSLL